MIAVNINSTGWACENGMLIAVAFDVIHYYIPGTLTKFGLSESRSAVPSKHSAYYFSKTLTVLKRDGH